VGVDFHGRVHGAMAKQLIKKLESLEPLVIEEPVLSEHRKMLKEIVAGTSVAIALGERLSSGRRCSKPLIYSALFVLTQTLEKLSLFAANASVGVQDVKRSCQPTVSTTSPALTIPSPM